MSTRSARPAFRLITALGALTLFSLISTSKAVLAYDFSGTTLGEPTWNRPLEDLSALSSAGTNVSYSVFNFTVSASGNYDFLSTGNNPSGWDNFTFLYKDSFNSSTPLINALYGNDDYLGTTGISGIDQVPLTANTQYYYVTTGWADSDLGTFMNSINGPGAILAVPEASSGMLTLVGLALLGSCLKRRRSNRVCA